MHQRTLSRAAGLVLATVVAAGLTPAAATSQAVAASERTTVVELDRSATTSFARSAGLPG